ncbi:hypothetical protein D3C87_1988490 [compost metagenome]
MLGHLLSLFQRVRIQKDKVTGTRRPVRVYLQFQHAYQIAADGLNRFKNGFLDVRLFTGRNNEPTHFDDIIEDFLQMLFEPWAFHKVG